ncbi:precorrin-3B synthase [Litorisediminicola beolgyonensis]|uniref:Precorrin-3B synthase n=1 Tax=Litorisediminicola beolgyonensis TaxID=1173614 RepID=A0ABW3ZFU3_9RHOB
MSAPLVRGWCPGALRPMRAEDGLVVRVRPRLTRLSAAQAQGLAALAERYGAGVIEVTSRASLQLRGVSEGDHAALVSELQSLGLADTDAAREARCAVLVAPCRDAEAEALAAALDAGLAAAVDLELPSKFGFVVDCGATRQLADVSGDIRLERSLEGLILRADGSPTGLPVAPDDAVEAALELARWFVMSGGVGADGRGRMAAHLVRVALPEALSGHALPVEKVAPMHPGRTSEGMTVAAGFGLFPATSVAKLAEQTDALIPTPWRSFFLPGAPELALDPDLITDPRDPLLRLHGCTGAPACPQAEAETRSIARQLARDLPDGVTLHVSGCAKGCAHPGPADLTLTGRDGRFDLIRAGRASDPPERRGLAPDQLHRMFQNAP